MSPKVRSIFFFRKLLINCLFRERHLGGKDNFEVVHKLLTALENHDKLIKFLKENKEHQDGKRITAKSIEDDIEKLFKLKHMGPKIQEIVDARTKCLQNGIKVKLTSVFTKKIPPWFLNKAKRAISYVERKYNSLELFKSDEAAQDCRMDYTHSTNFVSRYC